MPDGSTVSVRIVAETGSLDDGLNRATTEAQRLASELQRVGNRLEKVDAQFVATGQRASAAASGLKNIGGAAAEAAGKAETLGKKVAEGAERGAAGMHRLGGASSGALRELSYIADEVISGRFSRIPGSFSVLANRAGLLGAAITALKGPFGIAAAAATALGGALYYVEHAARAAEAAQSGAYNAALVAGRNAVAAEANVNSMAATLEHLGVGQGTALPFAASLEGIPNLSEAARKSLLSVGQAWTAIQFGGDYGKAAKGIDEMFRSTASMKKLVDQNRLLTGEAYQQFATAAASGDTERASAVLAQGLRQRFAPAQAALTAQGKVDIAGAAANPEASFGSYIQSQEHPRLPGPLSLPSAGEMRANAEIAAGNRLYAERAGALQKVKDIQAEIAAGHIKNDAAAERAIDYWNTRAAQLEKQAGGGDQNFVAPALKVPRIPHPRISTGGAGDSAAAERAAIRQEAELFAGGERLKIQEAKGAADQIQAVYAQWLAEVASLYGKDSTQYLDLEREKVAAAQRAAEQQKRAAEEAERKQEELYAKATRAAQRAAEAQAKPFIHAFDQIGATFDQTIVGLIERTTTWQKGMQSITRQILADFIDMTTKMVANGAAAGLGSALGMPGGGGGGGNSGSAAGSFSLGGVLGSLAGGLFGKIGGGIGSSLFGGLLGGSGNQDFSGAVGGATSASGGGIFGLLGGIGSLFGFAKGGIVPSAAGGWAVPSLGPGGIPAMLHSNEMVLPENISQGLQGMIGSGGGGGGVSLGGVNISAVDAAGVARLFMANGSQLVSALNKAVRNGSQLYQG